LRLRHPSSTAPRAKADDGFRLRSTHPTAAKIKRWALSSGEMSSSEYVPIRADRVERRRPLRFGRFLRSQLRPPGLADIVAAAIVGKAIKPHRPVASGTFHP